MVHLESGNAESDGKQKSESTESSLLHCGDLCSLSVACSAPLQWHAVLPLYGDLYSLTVESCVPGLCNAVLRCYEM